VLRCHLRRGGVNCSSDWIGGGRRPRSRPRELSQRGSSHGTRIACNRFRTGSRHRSSRATCPPSVPLALTPSPCYGRTKSNKLCGDFRASMDLIRCTGTLGSTPVQGQSSVMELETESWLSLAWTRSKTLQPLLCVVPISFPNALLSTNPYLNV
jgi:hypothetical protein